MWLPSLSLLLSYSKVSINGYDVLGSSAAAPPSLLCPMFLSFCLRFWARRGEQVWGMGALLLTGHVSYDELVYCSPIEPFSMFYRLNLCRSGMLRGTPHSPTKCELDGQRSTSMTRSCIMRRWKSSWFELVLTARLSSSVTVVTSKARSHLIRWKEHAYLTKRETENKLVLEARRSDLNNWRKRCTATGCQDIWGGTIMHHHDETETAVKKLWPIYLLSSEQQNGCAVFRNLVVARQGLLAPPLLGACAHGYQQPLLDARANLLTILHSSPLLEMIEIVKFLLEWKQRMMEYWGHPTDTINKNNNSIMWSKQLTTVASNSAQKVWFRIMWPEMLQLRTPMQLVEIEW